MRTGILGTGNVARALGSGRAAAAHVVRALWAMTASVLRNPAGLGGHHARITTGADGPPGAPAIGATRTTRRCNRYEESVAFYRDVVGLPVVHLADHGPDGFGVAIFGLPGATTTFELLPAAETVPVDRHEQLVLYFPGVAARDVVARRLAAAGHEPAAQFRYWDLNDALTFLDPDGRELVLAPWVFGAEPPPMRRRAEASGAQS